MIGIDIGSNSIRIVKIDCASLQKIGEFEKVVRTAEDITQTGIISQEALDRIVQSIQEAKERIDFNDTVKAVATAAFRMAKNAKEAIAYIKEKSGIDVDIISPDQESYYSAKGVEFRLKKLGLDWQRFLLVDIGGGSTEVILRHRKDLVYRSFPVGILTTIQKYDTKEGIVFGIRRDMGRIKEFLHDLYELFGKPKIFVGTGGTPTTVAAMKLGMEYATFDPSKVNGSVITYDDIERAYQKLIAMPLSMRTKIVGSGREDAIIAGIVILEEMMRVAGYSSMVVVDDGVREGVALEGCEKFR